MKTIDWFYFRNSCESCAKARRYLDEGRIHIESSVNCKKEPVDVDGLKEMLLDVSEVVVTRGKKILTFDSTTDKQEIVNTAIGRSGNLRAPSFRAGDRLVVGYNDELYRTMF